MTKSNFIKSIATLFLLSLHQLAFGANYCQQKSDDHAGPCHVRNIGHPEVESFSHHIQCDVERKSCFDKIKSRRPDMTKKEVKQALFGCNEKGRCKYHSRVDATLMGCANSFELLKEQTRNTLKQLFNQESWRKMRERGYQKRLAGSRQIRELGHQYCIDSINPTDPFEDEAELKNKYRNGVITRREVEKQSKVLIYRQRHWDQCYLQAAQKVSNESLKSIDLAQSTQNAIIGMIDGWNCYNRVKQSELLCKSAQVITFGVATGGLAAAAKFFGQKLLKKLIHANKGFVAISSQNALPKEVMTRVRFSPHSVAKLEQHFYAQKGLRDIGQKVINTQRTHGFYSDEDIMDIMNDFIKTDSARGKNVTTVTSRESFASFNKELKQGLWHEVDTELIPNPKGIKLKHKAAQTTFRKPHQDPTKVEEWTVTYCKTSSCEIDGRVYTTGDVISSYPKCGPNVIAIPRAKSIAFCSKPVRKRRDLRRWRQDCSNHISKINKFCL